MEKCSSSTLPAQRPGAGRRDPDRALAGHIDDAVADVAPVETFEDEAVIEGSTDGGARTDLLQLDALGAQGAYRARNRMTVYDVAGGEVTELSLAPPLFAERTMKPLHRASGPALDDRIGHDRPCRRALLNRPPGRPVGRGVRVPGDRLRKVHYSVEHARPAESVTRRDDPLARTGRAVWARPEPFTPHRLITALRDAGFSYDHVVLLPTAPPRRPCCAAPIWAWSTEARTWYAGTSRTPRSSPRARAARRSC